MDGTNFSAKVVDLGQGHSDNKTVGFSATARHREEWLVKLNGDLATKFVVKRPLELLDAFRKDRNLTQCAISEDHKEGVFVFVLIKGQRPVHAEVT